MMLRNRGFSMGDYSSIADRSMFVCSDPHCGVEYNDIFLQVRMMRRACGGYDGKRM